MDKNSKGNVHAVVHAIFRKKVKKSHYERHICMGEENKGKNITKIADRMAVQSVVDKVKKSQYNGQKGNRKQVQIC